MTAARCLECGYLAGRCVCPPPLTQPAPAGPWLTPAEAAARFGVRVETLARWAREKRIGAIWTPGGRRRYSLAEIERLTVESRE